jgi:hypothetical protein
MFLVKAVQSFLLPLAVLMAGAANAQVVAESPEAQSDENTSGTPSRLDVIRVEAAGEPEPQLPLGTGMSGGTLATTPGSAGDPLRTLQSLPGLAYSDDSEATPAVRGSRPDDNYFEVDFIPADYLFHAGGLISVFNADLIESFSIYPSAYSAEYSGVTGGVFDVRLREPKTDRFHSTVDLSILQAGLLFEGPIKEDQSFYLAGRISYLDLLLSGQVDEEEEGVTLVQFPKYSDYQAKYVWRASDDAKLTLQANGATDDATIDLDESADGVATDPIIIGRLQEASEFNQQAAVLDMSFSENLSMKSAISHGRNRNRFLLGGAGRVSFLTDDWMLKSHVNYSVGSDHDVTVGAEITKTDFIIDLDFNVPTCTEFEADCTLTDAERIAISVDDSVTFGSFFIKDSWYVNDSLTLFPGITLQSEDYLDKSFVEPRFALEYALSDSLTLSAGIGLYHQAPAFEQIEETIGNRQLDYVESRQAVIGLSKAFDNGWNVKSELYYKKLDNLVTADDELRYANHGEGETVGLDTLIRKDLTDRLSGWLSVSVSESTRTNTLTGEKFDFEYDQPVNASLVGSYKLNENWTAGAKLWVHSGALYTPVVGSTPDDEVDGFFNPQYGALNSERFPLYRRLDLRFDRTFEISEGRRNSIYFEILNALGTRNIAHYEYNADYSMREEVEQVPTILALGFKAEF